MLGAGHTRQMCDTFHEKAYVVVRWQAAAAGIDFGLPKSLGNPRNNMFQNALIDLMKDVRRDGFVDVQERQMLPERILYGFDTDILAGFVECCPAVSHFV